MNGSGNNTVKLAEIFVRAPVFSLAFGAFAKLYEDEACLANYKALVWSKLMEFCTTLHSSRKNVYNLLSRVDVDSPNRLSTILTCLVCKALFFHPIVLFCGHAFCRKCVDLRFNCQSCSTSNTSGELNDCLLLSKAVQHFFSDVEPLYRLLDQQATLAARGHYKEMFEVVDQLLQAYPNNSRSLLSKAEACLLSSDFETALSVADQVMESGPLIPKWFCIKARALKRLGDRRRALEYFFKCFTIFPYSDCLRTEITLILDEVITNADVAQWKRIVESCMTESVSILDVLSGLSDDVKSVLYIEPWMRLSASCQPIETPLLLEDRHPASTDDYQPSRELIEAMRDDFQCALCLRIFLYPYSVPCGHTFCRDCIQQSLDYKPECPLCKTYLSNYVSASGCGMSMCIWKLVKLLFPNEISERQRAYEQEMVTFSRVGLDPSVELPVMLCCLAYPGMPCPLHIYEPRYRSMIRRMINSGSRRFGLFIPGTEGSELSEVGTIVQITNCETLQDGRLLIDTRGCDRVHVLSSRVIDGCTNISFEFYRDLPVPETDKEAYESTCSTVHSLASDWLSTVPCRTRASLVPFFGSLPSANTCSPEGDGNGPSAWVWWLVAVLPLNNPCRYKLLSCREPLTRLNKLKEILTYLASGQWKPCDPASCTGISC